MEVDRKIFLSAGIITFVLFGFIYTTNILLNYQRESKLEDLRDEIIDELENIKAYTAIATLIGPEEECGILKSQLEYFDKTIWDLGLKLDSYEQASRNIFKNPFYETQKKRFIVNQVLYLSLLEKMKETCDTDIPVTIIYFYANDKDCKQCDAQSFVLTDLNEQIDEEIAIFSLDKDIDMLATQVLSDYYNISGLPCTIIDETVYCGLYDKETIIKYICEHAEVSLCG